MKWGTAFDLCNLFEWYKFSTWILNKQPLAESTRPNLRAASTIYQFLQAVAIIYRQEQSFNLRLFRLLIVVAAAATKQPLHGKTTPDASSKRQGPTHLENDKASPHLIDGAAGQMFDAQQRRW